MDFCECIVLNFLIYYKCNIKNEKMEIYLAIVEKMHTFPKSTNPFFEPIKSNIFLFTSQKIFKSNEAKHFEQN